MYWIQNYLVYLVFKIDSVITIHPLISFESLDVKYCTEVLEIRTRKDKKFIHIREGEAFFFQMESWSNMNIYLQILPK